MTVAGQPTAGWYPDPTGPPGLLRYHDGTEWTAQTAPRAGGKRTWRHPGIADDEPGWMPSHWDGPSGWKDHVRPRVVLPWRLRAVLATTAAALGVAGLVLTVLAWT